ncbi:hypothetical protein CC85DRAFT_194827 [Cutaneotrichosporon oleaginosum]|uniref:Uncharacterized protein n=1 Tax=Cutaneotrichosporon oleaginosum TaxID=879819 RepID=A0A0J0XEL4_9TREE|nr:uncharacterized protein CC85DRAFT_194827 [Cutaneotrichosporon oleaginosum]KLT39510.1 hypothetical protein CC85DRAFT_194827 [Cutaneotrichosporon oleaginosum]TXT06826.1 hypothetical protein COLE_06157 [Cutaneotrichosporon oleaginosum]
MCEHFASRRDRLDRQEGWRFSRAFRAFRAFRKPQARRPFEQLSLASFTYGIHPGHTSSSPAHRHASVISMGGGMIGPVTRPSPASPQPLRAAPRPTQCPTPRNC